MKTHDDVETFKRLDADEWLKEDGGPIDLQDEARQLTKQSTAWEIWLAGAYNQESIYILCVPAEQRAGIAWGGDADWTDADGPTDALERYFGVGDKEMCN